MHAKYTNNDYTRIHYKCNNNIEYIGLIINNYNKNNDYRIQYNNIPIKISQYCDNKNIILYIEQIINNPQQLNI